MAALAGPDKQLSPSELEVAVLNRGTGRRSFRRLTDAEVAAALGGGAVEVEPQADAPTAEATAAEAEAEAEIEAEASGDEG